jgi:hypothetical protein
MINASLHFIFYLLGLDKPITQTSFREREVLCKYTINADSIVEIGVFEGVNTLNFAKHSNTDAMIFAIDPFFKGNLGVNYGELIAKRLWKRQNVTRKISIIRGLSWDVIEQIPDGIDLVFIDGDHSFEGVKRDFDLYSKKIHLGGVIALHDARVFDNGWTSHDWGPVVFVEKCIRHSPLWEIIEEVDSLVLIKKKCV